MSICGILFDARDFALLTCRVSEGEAEDKDGEHRVRSKSGRVPELPRCENVCDEIGEQESIQECPDEYLVP